VQPKNLNKVIGPQLLPNTGIKKFKYKNIVQIGLGVQGLAGCIYFAAFTWKVIWQKRLNQTF